MNTFIMFADTVPFENAKMPQGAMPTCPLASWSFDQVQYGRKSFFFAHKKSGATAEVDPLRYSIKTIASYKTFPLKVPGHFVDK